MNQYIYQWKAMPTIVRLLLLVYATCFLIGGLQHWLDIFNGGLFPYQSLPQVLNIYLTLLAAVDMVISVMLFIRPVAGIWLAMLIMASDLPIDFYSSYFYWNVTLEANMRLQLLVIFGLFVFISAPLLMRWIKNNNKNLLSK